MGSGAVIVLSRLKISLSNTFRRNSSVQTRGKAFAFSRSGNQYNSKNHNERKFMYTTPLSKPENKLDGAARSISNAADTVSERLEKFSHEAGKRMGNISSKVSDGATEYVDTGREYIKENPLQSAAIAAAAGVAVGYFLTLISRRR